MQGMMAWTPAVKKRLMSHSLSVHVLHHTRLRQLQALACILQEEEWGW